MIFVPVLLASAAAVVLASFFKPDGARSGALTNAESDALDRTLTMSPSELVSAGQAEGRSLTAVVGDLRSAAAFASSRGLADDARRLRLKAAALAVAPAEVFAALPPASAPALPAPGPQRPLIARMRCGQERCSVRPEPRPWDDSWGRFGFSIPSGWPVGVVSFEPSGWAEVSLDHPDHGSVTGFVELAKLVADTGQNAPQPQAQVPAPSAQPSTGSCPGGVCPIPGAAPKAPPKATASPFGGGSKFMPSRPTAAQRTRTRMQKLNSKRRAASA